MSLRKQQELLKNRYFLFLWLEQLFTQLAYHIVNFSLIISVFKLTNSNFSVGILLLCFYAPSAIFTLLAGLTSDFVQRKKIIIFSNIIWAVLVAVLSFLTHNFLAICIIAILIQITDEFFYNATTASIPCVVEKEKLLLANSLFTLTFYSAMILGSLTVGILNRFTSPIAPLYLASLLVACGAFLISKIKIEQKIQVIPQQESSLHLITGELAKGWQTIISNPTTRVITTFLVIANSLLALFYALSPGLLSSFGIESGDFSFVFVLPLSIGLLFGSAFLGKFGKRFRKISIIQRGMIAFGLILLLLAFIPKSSRLSQLTQKRMNFEQELGISVPLALIFTSLGFSGILVFIPATTSFQENLPEEVRGRASSTNQFLTYALSAVLSFSSGFISDTLGFFPLLLTFSLSAILGGIFSRKILVKTKILDS